MIFFHLNSFNLFQCNHTSLRPERWCTSTKQLWCFSNKVTKGFFNDKLFAYNKLSLIALEPSWASGNFMRCSVGLMTWKQMLFFSSRCMSTQDSCQLDECSTMRCYYVEASLSKLSEIFTECYMFFKTN